MMDILLVKSTMASVMSNLLAKTKSDSDCYPAVLIVEFSSRGDFDCYPAVVIVEFLSRCLKFGQVYEDPFYSK